MSSVKTSLPACRAAVLVEGVKARQRGGQHSRSEHAAFAKKKFSAKVAFPAPCGPAIKIPRGDRMVRVFTVELVSLLLAAGN